MLKALDCCNAEFELAVTDGAEIVGACRACAAASVPVPAPVVRPPPVLPPPPPVVPVVPVVVPVVPVVVPVVPVVWARALPAKQAEMAVAQSVRCRVRIEGAPGMIAAQPGRIFG